MSEQEYRSKVLQMVRHCKKKQVVLPEIIPHQEIFRNPFIQRYNRILEEIAKSCDNCVLIRLYDDSLQKMPEFYLDTGHPNEHGYRFIAAKILDEFDRRNRAEQA